MELNKLFIDLIIQICIYLTDKDKINLLSINKQYHLIKNKIYYIEQIKKCKIINLFYYDNFINIICSNLINFPKNIKYLTFGKIFNKEIKGAIPNSVTHLTFGENFNQEIKGAIPNSVTHLTFGYCFDQDIKGAIPNSVTHLTFGDKFNKEIKGAIPNLVTHLTFGYCFDQDINELSKSIKELTLFKRYKNKNIELLFPETKIIFIE